MATNQLKQSLWFMREILHAGSFGITCEELCSKWAISSMNDYDLRENCAAQVGADEGVRYRRCEHILHPLHNEK